MSDTTIVTLPKNSTEELRVGLSEYKGKRLINFRVWWRDVDGAMRPGKGGFAFAIDKASEIGDAIEAVKVEARKIGWLA